MLQGLLFAAPAFRPFQEVVDVMKEDPGATRKKITTHVKAKVQAADNEARLTHCAGLKVQVMIIRSGVWGIPNMSGWYSNSASIHGVSIYMLQLSMDICHKINAVII